jgi:hypothetical protein
MIELLDATAGNRSREPVESPWEIRDRQYLLDTRLRS